MKIDFLMTFLISAVDPLTYHTVGECIVFIFSMIISDFLPFGVLKMGLCYLSL